MFYIGAITGGVIGGMIMLALSPLLGKAVDKWLDRLVKRHSDER